MLPRRFYPTKDLNIQDEAARVKGLWKEDLQIGLGWYIHKDMRHITEIPDGMLDGEGDFNVP
jgi:hypothetical protein